MNNKTKLVLGGIGIFILGGVWGSLVTPNKEVVKQVEPIEVSCPTDTRAKDLKTIDDNAFTILSDVVKTCGEGFIAVSKGDATELQSSAEKINTLKPQMESAMQIRRSFLETNNLD